MSEGRPRLPSADTCSRYNLSPARERELSVSENNANLVWSIANLLRGPYKPKEYGDVVLPFTILRRLDCVLEPTRDAVLAGRPPPLAGISGLGVVARVPSDDEVVGVVEEVYEQPIRHAVGRAG